MVMSTLALKSDQQEQRRVSLFLNFRNTKVLLKEKRGKGNYAEFHLSKIIGAGYPEQKIAKTVRRGFLPTTPQLYLQAPRTAYLEPG